MGLFLFIYGTKIAKKGGWVTLGSLFRRVLFPFHLNNYKNYKDRFMRGGVTQPFYAMLEMTHEARFSFDLTKDHVAINDFSYNFLTERKREVAYHNFVRVF